MDIDNIENYDSIINDVEWKPHHENILIDWADKAVCYRWLHSKSCHKYTYLRNLFTIPVIIMSTLTGTANFAAERVPDDYKSWYTVGVGSINILAGIITTIAQFLKINELCESHRVSSISWAKFHRNIRVELVKEPCERTNVELLIKICKDEFDRLIETSPDINSDILIKFNKTFSGNSIKNKEELQIKKQIFKELGKPEILDSIQTIRNVVYVAPPVQNTDTSSIKFLNIIKNRKDNIEKEKKIETFINEFNKEYSRLPTIDEIYNNLESDLSEDIIKKYLSKSTSFNQTISTISDTGSGVSHV